MCVNSTPIERQYVSLRWATISPQRRALGQARRCPTVGNVLSRSASLRAEVRELELGRGAGRVPERVDVGEEVAADAVAR